MLIFHEQFSRDLFIAQQLFDRISIHNYAVFLKLSKCLHVCSSWYLLFNSIKQCGSYSSRRSWQASLSCGWANRIVSFRFQGHACRRDRVAKWNLIDNAWRYITCNLNYAENANLIYIGCRRSLWMGSSGIPRDSWDSQGTTTVSSYLQK